MGLSARRQKQRIPRDPRNLGWANDAARFGQNYLAKLGWDPSRGLGIAGDGRTDNVKVSQKQDTLGIGATRDRESDGMAWNQNKDFEDVLRRLNETNEGERVEKGETELQEKIKADGESRPSKKKRKIRHRHSESKEDSSSSTVAKPAVCRIPPRRAHRARVIASKSLESVSTTVISEILGVAPSESTLAPVQPALPIAITTSTKSIADYFEAKLASKATPCR